MIARPELANLRALMMSRFVLAFLAALRTPDGISRARRSFALGQIAKQVQDGPAMLADDDDVPDADLGLDWHGETTFCA